MCFMFMFGYILLLWLYVLGRYYPIPSSVFGSYIVSMMVGISRTPSILYSCIVDVVSYLLIFEWLSCRHVG